MERRRFFRIQESVGLSYRVLSEGEAAALATALRDGGGGIDYAANFDNRIRSLLGALRVQSEVAAELLELINRKLNLVISQLSLDAEAIQQLAFDMRQVSISACGLGCEVEQPLPAGAPVRLDLLLEPGDLRVTVLARVVACETLEAEAKVDPEALEPPARWFLRLDFEVINTHDQELLIQHVVRRQSSQLRQRRDVASPDP